MKFLRRYVPALAIAAAFSILAVACGGETISVSSSGGSAAAGAEGGEANLSEGGEGSVSVGTGGTAGRSRTRRADGSDPNCATNSDPDSGFTESTMTWGTIIPLTGALRPLGEQTARVMKTATETWLNSITKIPGPYEVEWGCSDRPGIFGRKVSLKVFSLQANTPDDALAGMRRLIDVEKAFLVRDCYLQSNLMGPATQYQNAKGVPGVWCIWSEMPFPQLSKWNFAPGVDPLKITGTHVGYHVTVLKKQRMAVIYDPSVKDSIIPVIQRVFTNLTGRSIPEGCFIPKPAQEASDGMRAEITQLRQCWGAEGQPDSVLSTDPLNGAFGAIEAKNQGWRAADFGVTWSCFTCWVQTIAELCQDACEGMVTDCQALPCIPWADHAKYPAAKVLEDTWRQYLSRDPPDILTYGPAAITGGLGLWLGMTGPELSRPGLRNTLENLKNWDAGIGPILNTHPGDHYGGRSVWLIRFTGRTPWFDDITGRFVPLSELKVADQWTENR